MNLVPHRRAWQGVELDDSRDVVAFLSLSIVGDVQFITVVKVGNSLVHQGTLE
jgi:hypothetical protein